jgi:uncharacterized protein with NRDE domain
MCLIVLNWQPGRPVPLLVAANRDEFYARPTSGLHHWPGRGILAGQDLQAGGTWLGLAVGADSQQVRMAALTNYRDVANHRPDAVSRGHLTAAFLNSTVSAKSYLQNLSPKARHFNPFNLILFDGQDLMGFESRHARGFALPTGITAVSNADFNAPWPKLEKLRSSFEQTLAADDDELVLQDKLFKLLSDERMAPDAALPQTGISFDRERVLSAAFIRTPDYGTRASSLICIKRQVAEFTEKSFDARGFKGEVAQTIAWGATCLT